MDCFARNDEGTLHAGLAGDAAIDPAQAEESVARLQEIRREVEALKTKQPASLGDTAAALLQQLAEQDPAACARVLQRFASAHPRLQAPS